MKKSKRVSSEVTIKNYFEYARQNPEKGKIISYAEAVKKILDVKAQKLKKVV